ncbi:MAG: hypothetical protein EA338_06765 [Roseinatronobacter sp.]|nr:MAG: hypothetical protein EA338_06765 [Roseinatronobacter sp.]
MLPKRLHGTATMADIPRMNDNAASEEASSKLRTTFMPPATALIVNGIAMLPKTPSTAARRLICAFRQSGVRNGGKIL